MRNKDLLKTIGMAVFVLLSGILMTTIHSVKNEALSQSEPSIDIHNIRSKMKDMSKEEIEKTILEIEKEIDKLHSEIR